MTYDEIIKNIKEENENFELYVRDVVSSTNDVIKDFASENKTVIMAAKSQTGGKGRLGRSFSSPEGGLYISFCKKIPGNIEDILSLMPFSAVHVCSALKNVCGIDCDIKWPNDVMYDGKKICGILAEAYFKDDTTYLILGIGINFNTNILGDGINAVCAYDITGEKTDLNIAAAEIINEILSLLNSGKDEKKKLLQEYKTRCMTLNSEVSVLDNGKKISGKAVDISEKGALIIQKSDLSLVTVFSGEATIIKK